MLKYYLDPMLDKVTFAMCNSLVLVHSSFGLEDPIALPPNIKVVGLNF